MRSTGWADVARWVGVLACVLLVIYAASSSAYASGGFGIERYALSASEDNSSTDTQAGSHPYELTAEALLEPNAHDTSADEIKNLDFELPPGLIVDPVAVPRNDAVGTVQMSVAGKIVSAVVYNLAPAPGEFARLGFSLEGVLVTADVSVRAGGDYGMTLSIQDLPLVEGEIESVKLTLGGPSIGQFLTLPTSCAGSLQTTLQGESWEGGKTSLSTSFPQLTGCDRLPFEPSIGVAPDNPQADELSGYLLEIHVPQNEEPAGLATAQLRDATVVFPAGVSLAPSGMEGLVGCSEAEFGLASAQTGMCPYGSSVGTVRLQTPLLDGLPKELEGHMYVAAQNANPLVAPYELYLEAQSSGLLVKLTGQLAQNPTTGQLTLSFEDFPQLSFSDIELVFFGGHDALLASPPACGMFTATSDLVSWSAGSEATPSASFQISTGAGGGPCPGSPSSSSSSSPDPASGPGPASTTPGGATDNASLTSTRIMTVRGGDAKVKLTCAGAGTCRGKLTMTVETRGVKGGKQHGHVSHVKAATIGTAGFSIPAGKATTIELELNATGRALLKADHGRLSASLTILKSSPAPSQTHIESVRLVQ